MNRKTFLQKSFYSAEGLSVATGFYSWQIEPFWLEFVKLKMPIKKLPAHLVGKTVMQIRNEEVAIQGLHFIGIDDYWGLHFNPKKATKKFNKDLPYIALCHNPDVCDLEVWNGYNSWILSGHTHGGQVKPPFLKPPILPVKNKRYSSGTIDLDNGRTLYINRALGCLHQVRFNVRPEITIFELENA